MKDGDLSNKVAPRLLLVFEGALGFCNDDRKYRKLAGKGKWENALEYWVINPLMANRILWLYFKKDVNTEVVTFISEEFADELTTRLDVEGIPIHRVWYTTPAALARRIAYMPDLAAVYDPEPTRWLTYGSKGVYITDTNQLGSFA